MKILVTGAKGNFGTALIPRLLAEGNELVLFDLEPMRAPAYCTSIQGDIRDAGLVSFAMQGCHAVIHAAGLGQGWANQRNEEDYYSINVTGTHNILRFMLLQGIRYLVYSSTDQVHGLGMRGRRVMDETVPCLPENISSATRSMAEELCRFYSRVHGIRVAMLRYGRFAANDWKTAGMSLLSNGVDAEDVVQANMLALGAVVADAFQCEPFLIHSATPFSQDDWPDIQTNPGPVIERYYPGAGEVLARHGLHVPHIQYRFDNTKAIDTLGYDPEHNFEQFISRLRKDRPADSLLD